MGVLCDTPPDPCERVYPGRSCVPPVGGDVESRPQPIWAGPRTFEPMRHSPGFEPGALAHGQTARKCIKCAPVVGFEPGGVLELRLQTS